MFFIYFLDWFENWDRNNEKWYIRKIWVKYKIIITVQNKIAEDVMFIVQYNESYN